MPRASASQPKAPDDCSPAPRNIRLRVPKSQPRPRHAIEREMETRALTTRICPVLKSFCGDSLDGFRDSDGRAGHKRVRGIDDDAIVGSKPIQDLHGLAEVATDLDLLHIDGAI